MPAAELLARARGVDGRERRPAARPTAGQADPGPRRRAVTERLTADVTIIGGGVAGCAAARRAAPGRAHASCSWRRALCGAGASGVNFGGVRQQGRNLAELPLARRSREIWDRLAEMLGEDVEFEATGHIKLARSDADMAELERYARDAADHGLELQLLGAQRDRGPSCPGSARRWSAPRSAPRTAPPIRASSGRPMRASRAGSARKCASTRRRSRRRADGRAFRDARPKRSTFTSRFLVNSRRYRGRQGRGLVRRGGAARAGRAEHAGDRAAARSS